MHTLLFSQNSLHIRSITYLNILGLSSIGGMFITYFWYYIIFTNKGRIHCNQSMIVLTGMLG